MRTNQSHREIHRYNAAMRMLWRHVPIFGKIRFCVVLFITVYSSHRRTLFGWKYCFLMSCAYNVEHKGLFQYLPISYSSSVSIWIQHWCLHCALIIIGSLLVLGIQWKEMDIHKSFNEIQILKTMRQLFILWQMIIVIKLFY